MSHSISTDRPILTDRQQVNATVASFWNKISASWSMIWGPHIHHGFYEGTQRLSPIKAQERLINKCVALLPKPPQGAVLDVGCGMGGTSLHLAEHYPVNVCGITLSPEQVRIATRRAKLLGIEPVQFRVDDALSLSTIPDASIDLVWSLESCEQFYDKALFLQQAMRVLKPGGQLLLATWCSSEPVYHARAAKQYQKLCRAFDLPYMPTMAYYRDILQQQHFHLQQVEDWTRAVEPSWDIGISLLKSHAWWRLLRLSGWRGLKFSRQVRLMRNAFKEGRVCYGVFAAQKTINLS